MGRRLELHALLETVGETEHVYFQPPESIKMKYPAIVYHQKPDTVWYADNTVYKRHNRYEVVYITRDPDSDIPGRIAELPLCRQVRDPYPADNLYHYPFELYF